MDQVLTGQFLVAMPGMSDERFAGAVIYLCAHSEDGAMGLVINREMAELDFTDLLGQFDLESKDDSISVSPQLLAKKVLVGGPVDTNRGFVLHTNDYFTMDSSLKVNDEICLTATLDVLRAMARGTGPSDSLLALGYCGWSEGQLEGEIRANGWLTIPHSVRILFEVPNGEKYDAALASIGANRAGLSAFSGNA
jgi:putative transcriptional regulator